MGLWQKFKMGVAVVVVVVVVIMYLLRRPSIAKKSKALMVLFRHDWVREQEQERERESERESNPCKRILMM